MGIAAFRKLFSGAALKNFRAAAAGCLPRFGRRAAEHLAIRLEFKGRVLYELSELSAADNITIGRSSECVWVLPHEDNVASGHHAVVVMRNGRFCLRDTGSRNGIFFRARKIQEKNLEPGDKFSIGSCTLFVERVRAAKTARHQLVFLNTDRRGEALKLELPQMVLGSAPGCDFVIDEQLVSQKHAEFNSKADGCWLKDLGSKNGTFVNGTRLSPATERLLADDDVVSVAFVDFKFVDGRVEHSQIRIWYSLAVVAATVFVVLALNWIWMGIKPSSDSYLNRAREAAAGENFAAAREYLKESRTRRGAESNEVAFHELEQSVAVWENIHAGWGRARAALTAGNWIEASHILGTITDADPNVWGWNDTGAPEMRKAAFAAKKLLDAYLAAETAMRDDDNTRNLAELKQAAEIIAGMEKYFSQKPPEYLQKLLDAAAKVRTRIGSNLRYLEQLEAILGRIENESDNLAVVLGDLEELKRSADPGIGLRIENCMVPLAMLQRSGKQIKRAMIMVRDLEFSELAEVKLDLPTLEQCAVNKSIATLRKEQERQLSHIRSVAANLRPLVKELRDSGLGERGALPPCVAVFADRKAMERVFACDAFDAKMPSRLRQEPSGEYDRILGIEGFFEFMYALPAPYDRAVYSELQFVPEIVRFRDLLSAIRTFRLFADQPRHQWLHAGNFSELYERSLEVQRARDRLTGAYLAVAADSPRTRVLCRAIAFFLADGDVREADMEAFVREFKALRTPLMQLSREYNTASPERKIEIRDEILSRGVPGDPLTKRMWGFKKYPR